MAHRTHNSGKGHAGHKVALTGEMKGDSITVSKVEMPKPAAAKK